jgi:hypothetical protein
LNLLLLALVEAPRLGVVQADAALRLDRGVHWLILEVLASGGLVNENTSMDTQGG